VNSIAKNKKARLKRNKKSLTVEIEIEIGWIDD
jgi:hypothetical protein